jgi:hypothetical protein
MNASCRLLPDPEGLPYDCTTHLYDWLPYNNFIYIFFFRNDKTRPPIDSRRNHFPSVM